jgi:predicted transcriptional regulator
MEISDFRRLKCCMSLSACSTVYFHEIKEMSATVRINPESHRKLKLLAKESGASMPTVLEQAIETLRRQHFLDQASQAYGKLRHDKKAWAAEQAERKAWDKTLKSPGLRK